VFSRLGLNALPALFHWGPSQVGKPGKKAALPDAAKVRGRRGRAGAGRERRALAAAERRPRGPRSGRALLRAREGEELLEA
jgi:hypothetical protein